MARCRLVLCGPLLQLAERTGGFAERPVVLPPDEAGAYAEGMAIPADVLGRGYRLPTEAEWEYACRAGAVTSRYYGHSLDLLYAYAWSQANSNEHAWRGSLFSNDLGLFDMLGNMLEWCQDSRDASKLVKKGIYNDIINISESIVEKNPRVLRGGTCANGPAFVRSAFRYWDPPSDRSTSSVSAPPGLTTDSLYFFTTPAF